MNFFFNKKLKYEEKYSKTQPFSVLYNNFLIKVLDYFFNKNKFSIKFTKNLKKDFKENLYYEVSNIIDPHIYNVLQIYKKGNPRVKNITTFYEKFLKNKKKIIPKILEKNINLSVRNWIRNNNDIINRFIHDEKKINNIFNINSDIKKFKFGLGDKHNNHKAVTLIIFKNNKKILYKPRNAEIDENYNKLIDFVNKKIKEKIKTTRILNKKIYSWHEFISPIKSNNDVYKNFGKLLSVAYLLKITDLHQENIIINDNFPIPIDLESILVFRKSYLKKFNYRSEEKIFNILEDSLLNTGILPSPILINNKLNFRGGIYFEKKLSKEKLVWRNKKNINIFPLKTNELISNYIHEKKSFELNHKNRLIIKKWFFKFNNKLRKLIKNKEFKSLIQKIYNSEVRFIFRSTYLYFLLIKKIRFLESNKFYLRKILKKIYDGKLNNIKNKIIDSEINQLINLDIPYFKSRKNKIYINENDFIKFPLKDNYQKIYQKNNLEFQERIINYKMQIRKQIKYKKKTIEEKILDTLLKNQIFYKNSYSWINKNFNHKLSDLGCASDNFYNGNLGILIYLAGYYKYTHNQSLIKIIDNKIKEIFQKKSYLNVNKTGILDGVGSYIYFLILISNLLNKNYDQRYLPNILKRINFKEIINNNSFDLIDGNSGLLISIVRYYEKFKNDESYKILNEYGMQIFNIIKYKFEKNKDFFLPGFSHGIAGIAYALTLFNFYIKDKYIDQFILILIKFENKNFYSDNTNNWINTSKRKKFYHDKNQTSWCHGSLGVALSRVGVFKYSNNSSIRDIANLDIQRFININNLNIKNFTLCCGQISSFRLIDYFDKNQGTIKNKLKLRFIKDLRSKLKYNIYDFNNSFFYGLSGIGYYHLKIIKNIKLPDISLLET
jgi:type 2 lantibiotic biosynthesis protein LanM